VVRVDDAYAAQTIRGLSLALRPSPPDCESEGTLAAKVALAREHSVQSVDFYNYGFVRLEALGWIRAAIGTP
jgi:hypothetical protein